MSELQRLRQWKAEASEVIMGLQDVGRALDLPPGTRITGTVAATKAKELVDENARLKNRIAMLEDTLSVVRAEKSKQAARDQVPTDHVMLPAHWLNHSPYDVFQAVVADHNGMGMDGNCRGCGTRLFTSETTNWHDMADRLHRHQWEMVGVVVEEQATQMVNGELSEAERRALRCQCVRLDDVWHHQHSCLVPAVQKILAAHVAELRYGLKALRDEWWNEPDGSSLMHTQAAVRLMHLLNEGERQ